MCVAGYLIAELNCSGNCYYSMKNYFIVGAASGIGKALTLQLTEAGNRVYGTYNATQPESPEGARFARLDVLQETYDLSFLPEVLHGFVYAVGSISLKPFTRLTVQDYSNDYSLQVIGAVRILQQILPKLKKAGNASVVLFSTVAVQTGFPYHALVSSSKGAVEGLTRALAAELAPALRVNCIAPSVTDTPLASFLVNTPEKKQASEQRHPLKKIGTPEEVASLAAYLLSENAGFITGQIIHANGGIGSLRV